MANEPSLSEINSYRPTAEQATNKPSIVYDISSGLGAITNAARDYSQNLLQRYALFQKNLSDYAANHQLDFTGVMPEDIAGIKKKAVDYFAKVQANPSMIHNIGNDPDWQDIQADIAKSKGDNSYLAVQNQFRTSHPDLFNATNDDIAMQFRGTPLATRKAFNWDLPATIDIPKLTKAGLETIGEAFDTQTKALSAPGYFLETKGKSYAQDKFDDYVKNIYDSGLKADEYGHSVSEAANSHFNLLPQGLKNQFQQIAEKTGSKDAAYEWFKAAMQSNYKPLDITDTQLVEDQYGIEKEKLDLENKKYNLDWWKAHNIDLPKANAQMALWKSNTIGGEDQKNAALAFTGRIMKEMEGLGLPDKNGQGFVIPPNNIRKMTGEQLKYLGIDTGGKDALGRSIGFQTLDISDRDAIEVLPNGQIRVLEDAYQLPDGRFTGKYNQNKSTSVQNITTNRVNEEIGKAGSKELNAYLAPDLFGQTESGDNTVIVSQTPSGKSEMSYNKGKQSETTPVKKFTYNYKVNMNGKEILIHSDDGTNWVDDNGNPVK